MELMSTEGFWAALRTADPKVYANIEKFRERFAEEADRYGIPRRFVTGLLSGTYDGARDHRAPSMYIMRLIKKASERQQTTRRRRIRPRVRLLSDAKMVAFLLDRFCEDLWQGDPAYAREIVETYEVLRKRTPKRRSDNQNNRGLRESD